MFRKIYQESIWSHGRIPPEEWKYRNLKRVMFPVIDVLFIIAGFTALKHGVPAIDAIFPEPVVDIFGYAVSFCATVCLIGVSFPKLWTLEIFGKTTLLGVMTCYFLSLFVLTFSGDYDRGFVLLIAAVAMAPIVWRITLLGSEWQYRRLELRGRNE